MEQSQAEQYEQVNAFFLLTSVDLRANPVPFY